MARNPKTPNTPGPTSAERRAAALRENLRRRKRQQRLRRGDGGAPVEKATAKDDG